MFSARELLQSAINELNHLATTSLDAEVLLSFVLDKPREYLLAHPDEEIKPENKQRFDELIARRAAHEPVAYLTNQKEFFGRNFFVDSRVHIPRPATEDMVELIKRTYPPDFAGTMADIGTGSGCLAVTLALAFPQAKIFAVDVSPDALAVARQNAKSLGAEDNITFLSGDLLSPLPSFIDMIVANLPYGWSEGWSEDQEIKFQPSISYESGQDGLTDIRRLIEDLSSKLSTVGAAFLEFDPRQTEAITNLVKKHNFGITISKDLAGFDRIACLRRIS